jgi:hypothetical protein
MEWYRSKLILETEDSANFQPIFDKWEEITESRSLLKAFVPASSEDYSDRQNAWGTAMPEHPLCEEGFFESFSTSKPPVGTNKLEASFKQPGWSHYVGYRRLSYLLPGVTIHLYDPDLDKDSWYMRFLNGQSFAKKIDYTLLMASFFAAKQGELPLGGAPWISYSEEDAQIDIFGRKYYWDLKKSQFQFIDVEIDEEIAEQQPLASALLQH